MWRVTIKGLLAHKLRLALTGLAIVLGVTFISGTLVLTDTLRQTFTNLFGTIYQNIDLQVRGVAQLSTSGGNATRNPIPQSVLTEVRQVPGVEAASGTVDGYAQFVGPNGKAIANGNAPTTGLAFDPDPRISELRLVDGRAPTGPHDVVMDAGTAKKYGFQVGQQVGVLLEGPRRTFTITGLARVGGADNIAGVTLAAFSLHTAQSVLNEPGHLDTVNIVTDPGSNQTTVRRDIARILPRQIEVVTGQTVINEQTRAIDQDLSFFSTALLVFAFISLFVGAFTIVNTFSILVGQRTRELAMLRLVGASRRQVFGSVIGEAAIVGLISSAIGVGLGVGAALALRALLRGFSVDLPSGHLVIEARTVVVGVIVGVGVTVVAAISPARRAVRIPPIAAINEQLPQTGTSLRRRLAAGSCLAALGGLALGVGLAEPAIKLVGLGAAALFIGVAVLAPALARPFSGAIGRPLARLLGAAGRLGRENSMRSPRRTAQTASALMIGLALVSAISVFGASASRSATSSVDNAVSADLIVSTSSSNSSGEVSHHLPALLARLGGVTATSVVYGGQFELRGSVETLRALSTTGLARTVILRMTAGSPSALAAGDLLIDTETATSDHLTVGDHVPVTFARTGSSTMRIGGIYKTNALITSYLVSAGFYRSHFRDPQPGAVLLKTDGAPTVERAVKTALAAYPNVQVQSRAEFEKAQTAQVNQLLGLVYALLALAVIIALIGIVNTLLLSVFERTREIGLLRAVGMKRHQVRTMIRSEAVILAIFGAVIGIALGTGLGIALVASLHSQGITDTVVPIPNLVVFLVIAATLGLLAAGWPARKAARLDVLAAITAD